jgi:hypothetical protein
MSTPPPAVKVRLFANPTRPNSAAAGGAQQIAHASTDTNTREGQYAFVVSAAKLYGISPATLWGVYGTESGFGVNLGPSSAGALGPFQFLPSTAREQHVDVNSFTSSALGAARYLHQLGADGNPNSAATAAALNSYSGGGGAAYVNSVLSNGAKTPGASGSDPAPSPDGGGGGIIGDIGGALGSLFHVPGIPGLNGIGDALGAIGSFFKLITSPDTWFRVGKGILGFALIIIGTGALVFVVANKATGGGVTKAATTAATLA